MTPHNPRYRSAPRWAGASGPSRAVGVSRPPVGVPGPRQATDGSGTMRAMRATER